MNIDRNLRKERIGIVTSNKMEKSIIISEVKRTKHPMYGKYVLKTKKYTVHDLSLIHISEPTRPY